MKCLTWNLAWASPSSKRLAIILESIEKADPDIVCYTEVIRTTIPRKGCMISAAPDFGYPNTGEKRKVVLWSKQPWSESDDMASSKLPTGRCISGVSGGVRFVGVCIPWRDAHVRSGRKDREAWEEHSIYCHELGSILEKFSRKKVPLCVLGDFNLRIPKGPQPPRAFNALREAIPDQFHIPTEGVRDSDGKLLIDHFVFSPEVRVEAVELFNRFTPEGTRLSDHVGVLAKIRVSQSNKAERATPNGARVI